MEVPKESTPHVYEREIDGGVRTSLSVLAARIAPNARVLDLGCGDGALGRYLVQRAVAAPPAIDGLTINAAEAERARAHYRRVVVANLDQVDLLQLFERGAYDVIVCADVLEHVLQSPRVLHACRELLAPGGSILLSIPNASYCGLIAELMAGEFRYRPEGLLDATHVRFFTRATLQRFLAENGWHAEHWETITRELPDSEFHAAFDALPPAVARYLLALPDTLTYQFTVQARPADQTDAASLTGPTHEASGDLLPARALFSSELFWSVDGNYAQTQKLTARGEIGCERQTLRFDLPAPSTPVSSLRLDLADRPGFIHLYGLTLIDRAGKPLWRWTPADLGAITSAPHTDLIFAPPAFADGGFMVLMYGNDPWIELPVPPLALAQAAGGVLAVELGWPMSADYLALSGLVRAKLADQVHRLQQHSQALENEREQITQQLHDLQRQAREIEREAKRVQNLQRQQQREFIVRTRDLSRERDEARQLVRDIEKARLFRITRPLVHAKLRIERLLAPKKAVAAPTVQTLSDAHAGIQQQTPVDVIVPIYRGLEDSRRCIESVLRASYNAPWQLVLINDASPEPDLTAWLRSIAAAEPRITLLENEHNQGFVATVNRGMALSPTHDVLLLNSDTEVAGDWLDRLRAAAYGAHNIASVTPFSNNATICSYPRFCQDNELPEGWDTARLDALFARVNPAQVVDVPTGVGFCMYIRRAALDAVGPFDVEHFGKGYGEENDFCIRAQAAGWRNLHALNVFVRHFGGVSFGAAKSKRERAAMETLRRLHPRYEGEVLRFIQADPARVARHAVDAARILDGGKPVILAVLHDRQGGTVRHVYELAALLHEQARFLVLRPEPGNRVSLQMANANDAFELHFTLDTTEDLPSETGSRDEFGDGYADLLATLRAFGVCHVHYHHRIGHGAAIMQLARRLGVEYDFTAHDYYTFCPQITLVNRNQTYCGEPDEAHCNACLKWAPAPNGMDIAHWRQDNAAFLAQARFACVPSRDALARLLRHVPAAPFRLLPHPDIDPRALPEPRPQALNDQRPLKVAVIGALSVIKGADVLEDTAVVAKKTRAPVEFHLIGYGYRTLQTQPHAHLTVHGRYDEKDLPDLLNWLQPDVVWFPAVWPETYCYTLSASLQGGWPVVAPDIGAFPERLTGRRWTWIKPWQWSAPRWLAFFVDIREQHFCTGTPPVPPLPVLPDLPASVQPGQSSRDWYAGPYLAELPSADHAPEFTLNLRNLIAAHQPTKDEGMAHNARGLTLRLLTRARAWPPLARVARDIPQQWQTRIKSWLLK